MFDLLFSIIAISVFSFLPVTIVLAAVLHRIETSRIARIARTTPCQACSQVLGPAAIERSDQVWRQYVETRFEDTRARLHFRTVRAHHAICISCGRAYRYLSAEQRFVDSPT